MGLIHISLCSCRLQLRGVEKQVQDCGVFCSQPYLRQEQQLDARLRRKQHRDRLTFDRVPVCSRRTLFLRGETACLLVGRRCRRVRPARVTLPAGNQLSDSDHRLLAKVDFWHRVHLFLSPAFVRKPQQSAIA